MQDKTIFTYKAVLSYIGTNYSGWQFQTDNPNTIQNHLQLELSKIMNYQDIKVIATSRTDSGVHASHQVIKISISKYIDPNNLLKGLNTKLPNDIKLKSIEYMDSPFNLNDDLQFKEYHYYFSLNSVEQLPLVNIINYISLSLDIELMQKACKLIIGKNNFANFCPPGQRVFNTIRQIEACSIEKTSFLPFEENIFYFKIRSSGFLKYMVRFLMGTLIEIGQGKISLAELEDSLKNGTILTTRPKVKPSGLHLMSMTHN